MSNPTNTESDYTVCQTCAVALVNDDWTSLDLGDRGTIDASIEAMGLVTHVDTVDVGAFHCFVCDDDHYGDAHRFTAA